MTATLANGAALTPETWADFVQRLKHHHRGEGVSWHGTAAALFTVQELTYVYGLDAEYEAERIVYETDGKKWTSPQAYWDDADEEQRLELDKRANEETGQPFLSADEHSQWSVLGELDDHYVTGRDQRWDFVGAHLTREAAEAFITRKSHDYPDGLRVYVEAQPYAWEFEAIKHAILSGRLVLKEAAHV